jgi:2-aminoadipate transaminase
VLALKLERGSETPLHEQVAEQIRALIEGDYLPPGTRLPSSRDFARMMRVGRNTIVAAYARLMKGGWVECGVGRGTFVARHRRDRHRGGAASREPISDRFVWERSIARRAVPPEGAMAVRGDGPEGAVISFAGAVPDPSTYPVDRFRRILEDVLRREGSRALGYGPPAGFGPLREFIATRAARETVSVRADDVLIVGGSQQGLDLIARLFLTEGDAVVVEAPTYANALQIWQLYGARVHGVPLDENGMVPGRLEATLRQVRAKFIYVMPTFQNPTGLTMDADRRVEILRVAREADVGIVEDQFDTDLRYRGAPVPSLRAFDASGQVILLGTFSKILFPGFRLGWIIAPPGVRDRLLEIKRTCDLATSLPSQMAVEEFCRRGELDRHLERVRTEHGSRLETMLDEIARHFPKDVTPTRPDGGMTVWVSLPEGTNALDVLEGSRARGVIFAPGTWFFADGSGASHFRLSFVGEPVERIATGIRILGQVLAAELRRRPRRRRRDEEAAPFL